MKTYVEFVTEMSKSDLQELESRLIVLIEHLLKVAYVTGQVSDENARGWNQTVRNQRRDLAAHLKANPGLKSKLTKALIDKTYRLALVRAKTGHPTMKFPSAPLVLDDVLGPLFETQEIPKG